MLCSYDTSHITPFSYNTNHISPLPLALPPAKRVIMMLSLKEGTGNTITGNRIANHLLALGYAVQMVDTTDQFADSNLSAIVNNASYNRNNSAFYALFCIHALRSGIFAFHSSLEVALPSLILLPVASS